MQQQDRQRVERKLLRDGRPKAGLAETLSILHECGALQDMDFKSVRTTRRRLQQAVASDIDTPYGKVRQFMRVDIPSLENLCVINPFAFLWLLCSRCLKFYEMMESIAAGSNSVVIYIDELNPGNPFRPSYGRKLQCIYWAIPQWPQWFMQQADAWPTFCCIRSGVVAKLPGGVSSLLRSVLHEFWSEARHNFARGFVLQHGDRSCVFRASFCGFLADLAEHQHIYHAVGASGRVFCPTCRNVCRLVDRTVLDALGLVYIDEFREERFIQHTNETLYACLDHLRAESARLGRTALGRLQTNMGFNHCEHNLLYDPYLRAHVIRPVQNVLRDWMHCLASYGVANSELAFVMQRLSDIGVGEVIIKEYAGRVHLPKKRGKLDISIFDKRHLHDDHISGFASDVLLILMVLTGFLKDVISPLGHMQNEIHCLELLYAIVSVLQLGHEKAMPWVDTLRSLIRRHHELYCTLYGDEEGAVKPKWHHMIHLPDTMLFVGRLMSCWVTERKHKATKRCALHVFRHLESTVLTSLLNRHLEMAESLSDGWRLVKPKLVSIEGNNYFCAKSARLLCGIVHSDDFVILQSGAVGQVMEFWRRDDDHVVKLSRLAYIAECIFDLADSTIVVVDIAEVVDVLSWVEWGHNRIRVYLPFEFQAAAHGR